VPLTAGSRLGPYEILAPIGAGGMGEVYRARDTRLERTVAVKVLPSHLPQSEDVRLRFEREAKTISQLSHPHICALYDVGSHEGTEYLVMELLEGETLAARLAKGPLPLEQTLRYGVEISDALDKAHRGIVHRDLKPGNVECLRGRPSHAALRYGAAAGRPNGVPELVCGLSRRAALFREHHCRGSGPRPDHRGRQLDSGVEEVNGACHGLDRGILNGHTHAYENDTDP
jgi:hypothetical protein